MRVTIALLVVTAGCAAERSRGEPPSSLTWRTGVGAVLAERCADCHGGTTPDGDYDLTSYLGALGTGTDQVANAVAGDATSLILTTLVDGAGPHAELGDLVPMVREWVVEARLAYLDSPLHPGGLMNPVDDQFHGAELRRRAWDFAVCQRCHAQDFSGGDAERSCLTCHEDGPTACDTCHGQPPASGAHARHVGGGPLERPVPCGECHVVPESWDAPGHILADGTPGGTVDEAPAEVRFDTLADRDVDPPRRTQPAAWDASARTCTAVYCHGGVLGDSAALHPTPSWDGGSDTAACGGCHGRPPADHASSVCASCHPKTIDGDGELILADHLDGVLDVGDGSGTCTGCHGDPATGPAPARGLLGETLPTTVAVGAHLSHLFGTRLRGPVPCDACHVVPTAVDDAGHIDSDVPAEVTASLGWDRNSASCATAWCHRDAQPIWTDPIAQAGCGTCHAVPPAVAPHNPAMLLSDCATCHPNTVDAYGNILVVGGTSQHIDGDIDAP